MSMSPILRGLLTGLQSGLQYESTTMQQDKMRQQKLEDEKAKGNIDLQNAINKDKAILALQGPKTQTQTIADPNNPSKNIVQNVHWEPAEEGSDPNLEKGQFLVDSTANDPNTMKLDNAADISAGKLDMAGKSLEMRGQIADAQNQARMAQIDAAASRAQASGSKYERAGVMQFIPTGNPGEVQPVLSDGKGGFVPYQDSSGKTPTGRRGAPTVYEQKAADAAAQEAKDAAENAKPGFFSRMFSSDKPPVQADPGSVAPSPMSQFSGAKAKPANSAPADGTVLYKNGQKYIVQNGVPVPAQ